MNALLHGSTLAVLFFAASTLLISEGMNYGGAGCIVAGVAFILIGWWQNKK